VVIAIIAILAAILFPVFAQAKAAAKASVLLSNTKQLGTGIIIYTTDYDDTFPLGAVVRPNGGKIGTGVGMPFPYNDDPYPQAIWSQPARLNMAQAYWANAAYPYVKSLGLYSSPTANDVFLNTADGVPSWSATPGNDDLAFNGMLTHMSTTAVNSPSSAVLAWPATNQQMVGRSTTDPALNCANTIDDCQFNPGGAASAVALYPTATYSETLFYIVNGASSVWQFGTHRLPYVHTDTSAKATPTGSAITPSYVDSGGAFVDPFANVKSTGYPLGTWDCSTGKDVQLSGPYSATYWCFFRPDRVK